MIDERRTNPAPLSRAEVMAVRRMFAREDAGELLQFDDWSEAIGIAVAEDAGLLGEVRYEMRDGKRVPLFPEGLHQRVLDVLFWAAEPVEPAQ